MRQCRWTGSGDLEMPSPLHGLRQSLWGNSSISHQLHNQDVAGRRLSCTDVVVKASLGSEEATALTRSASGSNCR